MNKLQVAYAAGLIDGEACFLIRKLNRVRFRSKRRPNSGMKSMSYQIHIELGQIDETAIRFLQNLFGGSVWKECRTYSQLGKFPLYRWRIDSRGAEAVLRAIYPYLIVKKRHAKLLLEFRDHQRVGKETRLWHKPYDPVYLEKCEEFRAQSKLLNRGPNAGTQDAVLQSTAALDGAT